MSLPFRLSVAKLVKFKSFRLSVYRYFRLSVYRNAGQNEDPYYNEYLFAAQNQTTPIMPCIVLAWLEIKENVL